MDYEKAYKKALETARDFLDFYKDNPVQAQKFIDIFPELAESEDERIRKQLVDIVAFIPEANFKSASREDCRTYLEKLKEQKSAEWSDIDNIGWDEAFACVTRAEKSAKNEEELQNAVTAEKLLTEIKFKYYVHPVKQEWSEEDEDIRQSIIKDIKWERDNTPVTVDKDIRKYDGQINWLLSLHPSWKPSEEQMKALYDMVCECRPADKQLLQDLYFGLKKL